MPNKTIPILYMYLLTFEFPYLLPPTNKQGTSTSLPRTFSPDFRIDNLKTLVSTQSRPLISFLKFSVFSFLLTRHASLSHSDRREGGRREIDFFCACNLHILCLSLTYLFSYFLFFNTSVRPPRSHAKLKLKLKFGYSRSRVCSGIILLDGWMGVHAWMDGRMQHLELYWNGGRCY